METYTDNEGRTVLERRIHTDTKGTEHLDTYYVYDDLNRLRYVLPPQAEEIFRQAGETRSGSDKGIADYAYAPCYNGNISSISWKAGEEQITRGYRFTYDGLDRMKKAEYGEGERLASLANSSSKTGQTGKRNAPAMKITMILFRQYFGKFLPKD